MKICKELLLCKVYDRIYINYIQKAFPIAKYSNLYKPPVPFCCLKREKKKLI